MVFTPCGMFLDCGRKTPCQNRPVGVHRTSWCSPSLAPRAYSPADARRIGRMQSQTPIPPPPETHQPEPRDHHFLMMFPGMSIHEPKAGTLRKLSFRRAFRKCRTHGLQTIFRTSIKDPDNHSCSSTMCLKELLFMTIYFVPVNSGLKNI